MLHVDVLLESFRVSLDQLISCEVIIVDRDLDLPLVRNSETSYATTRERIENREPAIVALIIGKSLYASISCLGLTPFVGL